MISLLKKSLTAAGLTLALVVVASVPATLPPVTVSADPVIVSVPSGRRRLNDLPVSLAAGPGH